MVCRDVPILYLSVTVPAMKPLVVKVLPNGQTVQTVLDDSRYRGGAPLLMQSLATAPPKLRKLEYTDDCLKRTLERLKVPTDEPEREYFNIWTGQLPAGEKSP